MQAAPGQQPPDEGDLGPGTEGCLTALVGEKGLEFARFGLSSLDIWNLRVDALMYAFVPAPVIPPVATLSSTAPGCILRSAQSGSPARPSRRPARERKQGLASRSRGVWRNAERLRKRDLEREPCLTHSAGAGQGHATAGQRRSA
jgi:hypothetical protein